MVGPLVSRSNPGRDRTLAGDIELCSWAGHFTHVRSRRIGCSLGPRRGELNEGGNPVMD